MAYSMSNINSKNVFANINNNFNLLSSLVTKVLHHVERINRNDKFLKDNTIFLLQYMKCYYIECV